MKMLDYIPDGEQGMRSMIYLGSQAKEACAIEGAMSVWELLDLKSEENVYIVAVDFWAPLEYCDVHCHSCFIDGDYGYADPDNKLFFKISNYGKTWAAVKTSSKMNENDWNIIHIAQENIKKIAVDKHDIWWYNSKTKEVYIPRINKTIGKFDTFNKASNWMRVKRFVANDPSVKFNIEYYQILLPDYDFPVYTYDEKLLPSTNYNNKRR